MRARHRKKREPGTLCEPGTEKKREPGTLCEPGTEKKKRVLDSRRVSGSLF